MLFAGHPTSSWVHNEAPVRAGLHLDGIGCGAARPRVTAPPHKAGRERKYRVNVDLLSS